MAIARKLKLGHDDVFPNGAFVVSEVTPVFDFDRSTRENKVQQVDVDTGLLMWQIDVLDADPEATKKNRTVTVKLLAKVQPVPPSPEGSETFARVVFEGLVATPWIDSSRCRPPEGSKSHRCGAQAAWSFKAVGLAAPNKASTSSSPTKAA
jgi:hypothetical protein